MKLFCWNVAGIRARLKKGALDFLGEGEYDVVCFQETKAEEHEVLVPEQLTKIYPHRYWRSTQGITQRKGFSGTSIWSKTKPLRELDPPSIDAEGRVTLADTLSFAVKKKPDLIIDLATLTGACVVALGEEMTGVMSNNPELANKILIAAASAGEKMWELPLEKNYKKLLKSDIADLKNIGGRYGGALTAGLFLEEFVGKTPWAHLDIAGPAYAERPMNSYEKKGATGHGVRTLIEFLKAI